jgi:hypothetical protein
MPGFPGGLPGGLPGGQPGAGLPGGFPGLDQLPADFDLSKIKLPKK